MDNSESRPSQEAVAARLLAYGEEERRRVARELHDDISQRLAMLADDADRLRREIKVTDETTHRRLDSLVQQSRSLAADLRNISHSLHPAIIEHLGLAVSIGSLARHFSEQTGMPVVFHSANIPRDLPVELATALYRIAQESLRNIQKHAGETSIQVTLELHAQELLLVISDLGAGFDPNCSSGMGLISMRERAYLAGGSFSVVSAPGKGTTIQVRAPLSTTSLSSC